MTVKKIVVTGLVSMMLATGAAMPSYANDMNLIGTLLGAGGGAAIGSQFGKGNGRVASIAVGTLVGAGVGNSVSRSLGGGGGGHGGGGGFGYSERQVIVERDYGHGHGHGHGRGHGHGHRKHHWKHHGHHEVHETYRTYESAPDYYGTPMTNSYQNVSAQPSSGYCREFNQGTSIGGRVQPTYGTACMQPDGSWQIQN